MNSALCAGQVQENTRTGSCGRVGRGEQLLRTAEVCSETTPPSQKIQSLRRQTTRETAAIKASQHKSHNLKGVAEATLRKTETLKSLLY